MLGTELRTRRQRMGLTQETLAQKLGVHRTTVNRWEQGRLTIERPAMLRVNYIGCYIPTTGGCETNPMRGDGFIRAGDFWLKK